MCFLSLDYHRLFGMSTLVLSITAFIANTFASPCPGSLISEICGSSSGAVENWLYSSDVAGAEAYLNRSDIVGVQALYSWNSLEPQKDAYDFSQIETDLKAAQSFQKKLWVQLQDRSFYLPNNPVPRYVRGLQQYDNGSVIQCDGNTCDTNFVPSGWAASQWNAQLRGRFQLLLTALAGQFDGQIYGINLPETAIEVNMTQFNYSTAAYVDGSLENAGHAKSVFHETFVVQYVNFWPEEDNDDRGYMSKAFEYLASHDIGAGGPDNIPFKPGQENNSYPFLSAFRDRLPISVIAVQEPDLKEINPFTGELFTKEEFTDFAGGCLGSDIIFWALASPWLN
jgi:hypothetical protein